MYISQSSGGVLKTRKATSKGSRARKRTANGTRHESSSGGKTYCLQQQPTAGSNVVILPSVRHSFAGVDRVEVAVLRELFLIVFHRGVRRLRVYF